MFEHDRFEIQKDLLPVFVITSNSYTSIEGRRVTRLDGARGKKQLWHPNIRTWGISEGNLLYWRKYLWMLGRFATSGRHLATPAGIQRPGNCAPLTPRRCAPDRRWANYSCLFFRQRWSWIGLLVKFLRKGLFTVKCRPQVNLVQLLCRARSSKKAKQLFIPAIAHPCYTARARQKNLFWTCRILSKLSWRRNALKYLNYILICHAADRFVSKT